MKRKFTLTPFAHIATFRNAAAITDAMTDHRGNRDVTYDDLDRFTTVYLADARQYGRSALRIRADVIPTT